MKAILLVLASATLFAQQATIAVVEKKAGFVGFYSADGKRVSEVKGRQLPARNRVLSRSQVSLCDR